VDLTLVIVGPRDLCALKNQNIGILRSLMTPLKLYDNHTCRTNSIAISTLFIGGVVIYKFFENFLLLGITVHEEKIRID